MQRRLVAVRAKTSTTCRGRTTLERSREGFVSQVPVTNLTRALPGSRCTSSRDQGELGEGDGAGGGGASGGADISWLLHLQGYPGPGRRGSCYPHSQGASS